MKKVCAVIVLGAAYVVFALTILFAVAGMILTMVEHRWTTIIIPVILLIAFAPWAYMQLFAKDGK